MKFLSTLFLCFFFLSLTITQAQTICNTSPTPFANNVTINGRTVDDAYDLDGDGLIDFGYSATGSVNDFCGSGNNGIRLPTGAFLSGVPAFPLTLSAPTSGLTDFACEGRTQIVWVVSLTSSSGFGYIAIGPGNNIVAVGTTTESSLTWSSFGDGCPDPVCPSLTADAPVAIVSAQSSCSTIGGTPTGGTITAPSTNCPTGSTLMYSIDGTTFTTTLPTYDPTTAVTVTTICDCDNGTDVSPIASVTTVPGACSSTIPTMSQWGLMIFGLLILNLSLIFVGRLELA